MVCVFCNRMVDVGNELGMFVEVICKQWWEIVVEPLASFVQVSFGGDKQEFADRLSCFDSMTPRRVHEDVTNRMVHCGLGLWVKSCNLKFEGLAGESVHWDCRH